MAPIGPADLSAADSPTSPDAPTAGPSAPPADGLRPEHVTQALRSVIDPELRADIVELGMVSDVQVDDAGVVDVWVALTIAGCPLRAQIRDDARAKVLALPGAREVRIHFGELTPEQRTAVMQRARWTARERAPETEIPATTRVLAIASGKGGVGKSSITCNLAAALASRGLVVGVLDADIWGFSIPRMLGLDVRLGGDDGRIAPAVRRVGDNGGELRVVSMGLVVDDEDKAIMWRGLLLAKALEEFLTKVRWGPIDYLLIDMPPGTGDVQMALARLLPRAELLIVTTPARSAQKVAARAADMARRGYLRVAGVVENMSYFVCEHGLRHALFGAGGGDDLARETGAPLLAEIPIAPEVAEGGDSGEPVALGGRGSATAGPVVDAFHALAERVVAEVLPPVAMEGCTARLLTALEDAVAGP